MRNITLILILVVLNSCATVFNKNIVPITVITEKPTTLIINDTIHSSAISTAHHLNLKRSNKKLKIIETQTDSIQKTHYIKSKASPTLACNAIIGFFGAPGIAIDLITKKGYTYPRYINLITKKLVVKTIDSNYVKKKNIISILPLKLASLPETPKLEVAYEYRLNNRYSLQTEYLHYLKGHEDFNVSGKKIGLEFKKYNNIYQNTSTYLSLHFDNLRKNYNNPITFSKIGADINNEDDYILSNARIIRKTNSLNIKFGVQSILKQFVIDSYIGLGVMYRDVKHNVETPNGYIQTRNHNHDILMFKTRIPGSYYSHNIIANIKLGYSF